MRQKLLAFIGIATMHAANLLGDCMGKIDLGPAFVHIDVLENNKTVQKINMGGVRAEANVMFGKGWVIKPMTLYGKGDNGELTTVSLGLGRCIPATKKLIFTPIIGAFYTCVNTSFKLEHEFMGPLKFRESFRSISPFIGLETTYKIWHNLRLCGSIQYAWSRSKTKIKNLLTHKSNSQGPNLSALLEYDLNQHWSINIGGAYNESLSHNKDGLRGYGVKAGVAWWY